MRTNNTTNNTRGNRRQTLRSQMGFTLIELLVVMSTSGLLIGLLLPAVQKGAEDPTPKQAVVAPQGR